MTETELFRIKPVEWEYAAEKYAQRFWADTLSGRYTVENRFNQGWHWFLDVGYTKTSTPRSCASPEEGKQLAEAHWQEYIKQALIPVETSQ